MWRDIIVRIILIVSYFVSAIRGKSCSEVAINYMYSECDSHGERWKFFIPNETCSGNMPLPVKGKPCSFSCSAGTFLDLKSEACLPCPAGTFSMGGGYIYEDFTAIPSEFSVNNEDDRDVAFSDDKSSDASTNCKNGWTVLDGFLAYMPGPCLSTLSYSVHLVRPGIVRFTYLYSEPDVVFMFSIKNARCVSADEESARKGSLLKATQNEKWRTVEYALNSGQVLLLWRSFSYSHSAYQPVLIKRIEITGIAFAQQCTSCYRGTYSKSNAKQCTPCSPGHFSSKGATNCSTCDFLTTYSDYRASSCLRKPPCQAEEYQKVFSQCINKTGQANLSFRWQEPKTCSDILPSSVRLPSEVAHDEHCSVCNPGEQITSNGCDLCRKNFYSNRSTSFNCKPCPSNTIANYGYYLNTWYNMPKNMKATCESADDNTMDCKKSSSWILDGDSIKTAVTRIKNVYFLLNLQTSGFKNVFLRGKANERNPIGRLSFEFETKCSSLNCVLYFAQRSVSNPQYFDILAQWNGTIQRRSFSLALVEPNAVEFSWIFVRARFNDDSMLNLLNTMFDQAKIFSINVTNTIDGGASECLPCPLDENGNCQPCSTGHYLNVTTLKCHKCPENTILNITTFGDECVPCGPNMKSTDGVECDTDCAFNISGKSYDLSALKGIYSIKGVEIFNRDMRYYHLFNFTVCSKNLFPCSLNEDENQATERSKFGALACRFVIIPGKSMNFYRGTLELGDYLAGVSDNYSTVSTWPHSQLYFLYRSSGSVSSNANCPSGRRTVLIFRCDPSMGENATTKIELPAKCPDGTCDGCLFEIILTTRHACPICHDEKKDFMTLLGECHLGRQQVHYIPASHCIRPKGYEMIIKIIKCRTIPVEVQVVIYIAAIIALVLAGIVARIWKKNKRLQYKYMKLVESSSSGKDSELPGAESCAIDNDEENEDENVVGVDRVVFKKGKKSKIISKTIKSENGIGGWIGKKLSNKDQSRTQVETGKRIDNEFDEIPLKGNENLALMLDSENDD